MERWGVCEGGWRKGPWTPQEDKLLVEYVSQNGEGRWSSVSKCTGLNRNGKSCRLRWVNYLKPGLKKGRLTPQEEGIIIELHALFGNKWSTIARYLPGRTDNEIKNYWRTHFKKRPSSKKFLSDQKQEKQEEIRDNKIDNIDHEPTSDDKSTNIDDHRLISPTDYNVMIPPVDGCLWDGLWNLDDNIVISPNYRAFGKMGVENQDNIGDFYSCGGDFGGYFY